MDSSLKKLLLHHYKKVMIALVLIISGIYLFETVSGITSWKNSYAYFNSESAKTSFEKKIKESYSFDDQEQGKIFLYFNLDKEESVYTDSFEEYKNYSLTFFNPNEDANQLGFNAYPFYNEHFLQILIIFVLCGIFLFLLDLKSNFNSLLFTSKYKRTTIYWYKYYLIGGTLSVSLFLSKVISMSAYRFFIPSNYLNISLSQQIISSFSGWLTLVSIFILSSFLGLIIGDWLFGVIATLTILFTFQSFLSNVNYIIQTFFLDESDITSKVNTNMLSDILPLTQVTTQPFNALPLLILIVLACLTLFLGQFIFDSITLEDSGSFIIIPKLKRIIQIIIICYGTITFTTGTFILTFFPNEKIVFNQLILNLSKMAAITVGLYALTNFILYNKKPKILEKIIF